MGRSVFGHELVLTIRMRARAAKPYHVPSATAVLGREGLGRGRDGYASSSPLLLEPNRVEDLVVPEHVAARPAGLGDQGVRQADGLGAFDVELGQDVDARIWPKSSRIGSENSLSSAV